MTAAYLPVLLFAAYVILSVIVRRKERALGIVRSKDVRRAIWIGVFWVNAPLLPIMLLPLYLLQRFVPDVRPVVSGLTVLIGFLAAWAWWSVNISLWRRWALRLGVDANELQTQGESSSLLWPRGHFFERTECDRLRERMSPDKSLERRRGE